MMLKSIFLKLSTALVISLTINNSIVVGANERFGSECEKTKSINQSYALKTQTKRIEQSKKRFDFIIDAISKQKTQMLDTNSLESQSKMILLKNELIKNNYDAWINASKAIDCSSESKLNQSKLARDKAHQKAWGSFSEMINYYNINVRPLYKNSTDKNQVIPSKSF